MILGIDFDDTYTRDQDMWNSIISIMIKSGHTVYCVTARSDDEMPIVRESIGSVIGEENCIGTNGKPKKNYIWEHHDNLFIDVWIDDQPEAVVTWQSPDFRKPMADAPYDWDFQINYYEKGTRNPIDI